MSFVLFLSSVFLWFIFTFYGNVYFLSGGVLLFLSFIYWKTVENIFLPRKPLFLSKVILNTSFWSCIALALYNYQNSLTCLNCMRSYLNTDIHPSFGSDVIENIKTGWQNYSRFISIAFLLLLTQLLHFIQLRMKKEK